MMILLVTAEVTLDNKYESVQPGVGFLAPCNLISHFLIVTLGVVRKTNERVSQNARESHQLRYLAICLVQTRIHPGVVFLLFRPSLGFPLLLFRQVRVKSCLLFQEELHPPFEVLIAHSILSCWNIPRKCPLAYTLEVSSVEGFGQQVSYSIGSNIA